MMTSQKENKNGFLTLLASVFVDLGFPVIYDNLVYWARVYSIHLDDVDNTLKTWKDEGLLEIRYALRCPKCGMYIGEYYHLNDVPDILVCPTGHEISKEELINFIKDPNEVDRVITILWYTTYKGKHFFRTFQKRKEKVLQERIARTIPKSTVC